MTETRTIQVWPSGRGYEYHDKLGDSTRRLRVNDLPTERPEWREGTEAEWAEISAGLLAQRYLMHEIHKCDSILVDAHLEHHDELPDELEQEWTWENVSHVYPDPSEWDDARCHEWMDDQHGIDTSGMNITNLREYITKHAEPADIMEWWAVTEWLAGELTAIGQPVLDNAYGYWWGRCCTGQMVLMDGTLQEIARKHA